MYMYNLAFWGRELYIIMVGPPQNLIGGPLRALKALKALKKAQIGVQIGGPLCEKTERDRGMKISDFVDLD